MTETFVNAAEAGKLLGVQPETIIRAIHAGKLPALKLARHYRIAVSDLATLRATGTAPDKLVIETCNNALQALTQCITLLSQLMAWTEQLTTHLTALGMILDPADQ